LAVVIKFLTFITSSSLFSRFDRALIFCFAAASRAFPGAFADMARDVRDQNTPEVVMDFRQEQAGLS
jgi:hypothetical protein